MLYWYTSIHMVKGKQTFVMDWRTGRNIMLPANRVRYNYCINILHNYIFNLLCTVLFQQSDINIIMMVSYCLYLLKISEKTVCSQKVFSFLKFCLEYTSIWGWGVMVLNATFNNISVISWQLHVFENNI